MTRNKGDIVAQWPEPIPDRGDQGIKIAFREIRSTDRAIEQHVTHDSQAPRRVEENHMPGRMARTMQDLHLDMAKLYAVAMLKPAIRRKGLYVGKPEHSALLRHAINPEFILTLRPLNSQ